MPADVDLAAAARQRLTAGGQRAARRQDYEAAARLFERPPRCWPRPRSTSPSKSSWARSCSDRQTRGGTAACGCPHRAGSCGRRSCRRALRKDPRRRFPPLLRAADRKRGPGDTSRAGATRARGRGRRPCSLHRIFGARGTPICMGARTPLWRRSSKPLPMHSGRAIDPRRCSPLAPGVASPVDRRIGTACLARRARFEAGRDQFFRAYRAWSLAKLGQFDEARAIVAVARAEQEERGGGRCSRT